MRIRPEMGGAAVVLLGSFNPAIITPDWLARKRVVGDEQLNGAEIEVIHREVAQFTVPPFTIRVLPTRFSIETIQQPFIAIRDFTINTFNHLPETPVIKMGINLSVHFSVSAYEIRDRVGDALAPKSAWGDWAKEIEGHAKPNDPDFGRKHGGMQSLTMLQKDVPGRVSGHIQAKVEPSRLLDCGVFIEINDHYNATSMDGCSEMISILEKSWEESMAKSEWIIDQVMRLAV